LSSRGPKEGLPKEQPETMKAAKHRVSLRQRRPVSSSAGELFTGQQNAEFSADRWSEAAVPYERSLGKKMEAYTAASLHLMREAFDITHFGDLLDVGCGSGAVTDAVVAARYPLDTFTGIDYSEGMITEAKKKAGVWDSMGDKAPKSIRYLVMDGQNLGFDDATFSHAVAMFSIFTFPDKGKGMRELRRVIRPGGATAVSGWGPARQLEWVHYSNKALLTTLGDRLPKVKSDTGEVPNFQAFADPDGFRSEMRSNGWAGAEVRAIDLQFPFVSAAALEQLWLDMSIAYPALSFVLSTFPEADVPRIKADVAATFADIVHSSTAGGDDYGVLMGTAYVALARA
ncbi:Demethylmenaquinone methyltransferase, partial [Diplonema papillatum]